MENLGWVILICIFSLVLGIFFIHIGTKYKRKVSKLLKKKPVYPAEIVDVNLEKITLVSGTGSRARKRWVYMATLEFEAEEGEVVQHRLNLGGKESFAKDKLGTYEELYFDRSIFPQPKHISELEVNKSGTKASLFLGIYLILLGVLTPVILYLTN